MRPYLLLVLFVIPVLMTGCKKKKHQEINISGVVTDGVTGVAVSGATIIVSYQQYQNGVISSAYATAGTTTTASDGSYSLQFEKPNSPQYKIDISRTEYYPYSELMNPDNFSTSSTNTRNYSLFPSATFKIGIKNLNPANAQDKIVYQNLSENNSCSSCCDNTLKVFDGMNIDTSLTCNRYGDKYIKFQWLVTKNSFTTTHSDSIFCPKGQTTFYQINY